MLPICYFLFKGIDPNSASYLLSIIGITNTIGRVVCGYVADFPNVNALLMNNICLVVSTVAVASTPFCSSYAAYIVMSIFFGIAICKYSHMCIIYLSCHSYFCFLNNEVNMWVHIHCHLDQELETQAFIFYWKECLVLWHLLVKTSHYDNQCNLTVLMFSCFHEQTLKMWDLKFSQQLCWGFGSPGIWIFFVVWMVSSVSKNIMLSS
jgi:hypothetical protein